MKQKGLDRARNQSEAGDTKGDKRTANTKKRGRIGFAIEIGPDTQLAEGHLAFEYTAGGYAPVGAVSTPNEAQEIAASYTPEAAGAFRLWARGIGGRYLMVPIAIDGRRQ